jgi:hypothetical protein
MVTGVKGVQIRTKVKIQVNNKILEEVNVCNYLIRNIIYDSNGGQYLKQNLISGFCILYTKCSAT